MLAESPVKSNKYVLFTVFEMLRLVELATKLLSDALYKLYPVNVDLPEFWKREKEKEGIFKC